MEFGKITRGKGKLFLSLKAQVSAGGRIEVVSHVAKGTLMPALILAVEGDDYVVVLPSLKVEQTVNVRVLDEQGNECEVSERKIGHIQSAIESKYNTFRNNSTIAKIRNLDALPVEHETWMRIDRFVDFGDGTELVHGQVATCCSEGAQGDNANITVIDRNGNVVELQSVTVMNDHVAKHPEGGERTLRMFEVSIRKPFALESFFIWIRFEGGHLPDGLLAVEGKHVADYRNILNNLAGQSGQSGSFDDWFSLLEKTPEVVLQMQRDIRFEIEPMFSIIVPLFKTPVEYFNEMLGSVRAQTYGKWELLLINASPEDTELHAAVEQAAISDSRIRFKDLEKNLGITLNTNEGIQAASGDFLCFFDHDDLLEPDILFEYARGINHYPTTDLLYCDEDKLFEGRHVDGLFKPDFDWDMLTSVNYIVHMLTVRKSIVDEMGELPGSEFDGAQDHNLTMLVAEKARNIYHARKVLYHWRAHSGSTAADAGAKPWTQKAARLAIDNHFERIGIKAHAEDHPLLPNNYNVFYDMPDPAPRVSVIIPNKDQAALLDRCITSIFTRSTYSNLEIVVVENNSTEDETFVYYDRMKQKHENLKVLTYVGDFNFSAICNQGARAATGDYLIFLNNDTEVISSDWIEAMLGPALRRDVGCVGAKLLYPDDTIQHVGVVFPRGDADHLCRLLPRNSLHWFGFPQVTKEVSAVTGACLLLSRSVFDNLGGFDENYPVAYNDIDLCLRVWELGLAVVMQPRAELYHYESSTRGYDLTNSAKRTRLMVESGKMRQRWGKIYGSGDIRYSTRFRDYSPYCQLEWEDRLWGL
jgi:GT2 family glycosyltransferase